MYISKCVTSFTDILHLHGFYCSQCFNDIYFKYLQQTLSFKPFSEKVVLLTLYRRLIHIKEEEKYYAQLVTLFL